MNDDPPVTDSPLVDELIAGAREEGCLSMSEIDRVAEELELGPDDVDALHTRLREEGLDLDDDCGRDATPDTRVTPRQMADYTTDALQQFLNEAREHPLLTPEEVTELAQRI